MAMIMNTVTVKRGEEQTYPILPKTGPGGFQWDYNTRLSLRFQVEDAYTIMFSGTAQHYIFYPMASNNGWITVHDGSSSSGTVLKRFEYDVTKPICAYIWPSGSSYTMTGITFYEIQNDGTYQILLSVNKQNPGATYGMTIEFEY